MSEKPISPLRRRMIEDMTVRNFVEKTRNDYIRQVRMFTAFLGHPPDTATAEDIRRFQLHQTQTGVRPPSINGFAVLRFVPAADERFEVGGLLRRHDEGDRRRIRASDA